MVTGAAISAHGLSLIKNGLENDTDANLIDDLLAPQKMASTGGADGIDGLAKKTGISGDSIKKVYGDVSSNDIELLGNKLDKNLAEHLFNKGDGGGTGSQLVKDIAGLVGRFGRKNNKGEIIDPDALADIQRTLSANKPENNVDSKITDSQFQEAFSTYQNFLNKYKDKVSGAFAYTFGRSKSTALDLKQAQGEINLAEDLLDGKAFLKNDGSGQSFLGSIDQLHAPSDLRKLGGNPKTPDYFATNSNGLTRLAEIKTPTKKLRADRLRNSLGEATKQIRDNITVSNPNNKGIIRLDYRSSALPADLSISEVENIVKIRMNNFFNAEKTVRGSDLIDFVEVIYKDANNNNVVQTVVVKIN